MSCATPSALLEFVNFRYAAKQFDSSKKIDPSVWSALEQSLILTPSSFGLQPWKFLVITDQELREKLVEHSWGQRQVADCSHLVVMAVQKTVDLAYIDRFVGRLAAVRGVSVDSLAGYRGMMAGALGMMTPEWSARQVYIALGQFMLAAATLGVDTCPMEGFLPAKYDEILGLESRGLAATVICPAGYRSVDDRYAALPKVRWAPGDVIEHL